MDYKFKLAAYEVGDNMQFYEYNLLGGYSILIDIHSSEKLITSNQKLVDLLTQDDISYFAYAEMDEELDCIVSYCYRPLIPDIEKSYI